MAHFLVLVLVVATQLIGGFSTQLPPPIYGNFISILTIDGGGMKGILPSVVLDHLHKVLKLKTLPYFNAKLSDICIATSAEPATLPPYYFENDGTEAALSEVIRYNKYTKIVALSLGTGVTKVEEKYDVEMAAKWDKIRWIQPGLELLPRASMDMTEHYLATLAILRPPTKQIATFEFRYTVWWPTRPNTRDRYLD
ncbi:patatin-like protein 4 [Cajanus cajan]|uniref:patatin-like protein 4 n=1 Tax=Cajanus cajan TaxID=3821 RepID=UPI00098D9486|nr:patatin-like protein 4 [Cajanus cajan]